MSPVLKILRLNSAFANGSDLQPLIQVCTAPYIGTVTRKIDSRWCIMAGSGVLNDYDTAKFSWFHVKAVLISGVGFFTDAYDLFCVGIIAPWIAFARFPEGKPGALPRNIDLTVKGMALVGTLAGQVAFGLMGDRGGRKRVYGWTLWLMILASLLNAATTWGRQDVFIGIFCLWRFVLGFGIGGDYPLSAVITSEYSSKHMRGALIAAVFSMQGIGILAAAIAGLTVLTCFKSSIEDCVPHQPCKPLDNAWRVMVALGCIPAIATMYLRSKLPETPRYTVHVAQDAEKAKQDAAMVLGKSVEVAAPQAEQEVSQWRTLSDYLGQWSNMKVLIGTCATWFLLDVAYYSQNLLQSSIYVDIGYSHKVPKHGTGHDIFQKLFKQAAATAIVALMGTVPGYYVCVAFIETLGRKTIQFLGFTMMTVCLTILAVAYNQLREKAIWAFIFIYALMFFFANFGPNTTTFIIPGECFPTRVRSTCHGLSAAWGKAGAIVGLYAFGEIAKDDGFRTALGALAVFMFVGLLFTVLVPETKGKSLEELGGDELTEQPTKDVDVKSVSTV